MMDIASAAGMSKRTVYARYADKEALFIAAVKRAMERYTIPRESLEAVQSESLEETLLAVARLRLANVATPEGIRLQRIVNGQAFRFPELFSAGFDMGTGPTIAFLTELFTATNESGETDIDEPERAAVAFLSLVVGGPARLITAGSRMAEEEIENRIRFSVKLLLDGIRTR